MQPLLAVHNSLINRIQTKLQLTNQQKCSLSHQRTTDTYFSTIQKHRSSKLRNQQLHSSVLLQSILKKMLNERSEITSTITSTETPTNRGTNPPRQTCKVGYYLPLHVIYRKRERSSLSYFIHNTDAISLEALEGKRLTNKGNKVGGREQVRQASRFSQQTANVKLDSPSKSKTNSDSSRVSVGGLARCAKFGIMKPTSFVGSDMRQVRKSSTMFTTVHQIHKCAIALLLLICSISIISVQPGSAQSTLNSAIQKLKITSDIISLPNDLGVIKMELHDRVVKPGDQVLAKNLKDFNPNKLTWEVDDQNSRYTVILVDLDRKPNASSSAYNQYTSFNIQGNNMISGQALVALDYPSVPCLGNSKHRMLMLALQQEQNIDITDVAKMAVSSGYSPSRENFKLDEFIKRYRLRVVAANVFLAAGEVGGLCSSASSIPLTSSISIAMVIAVCSRIASANLPLRLF